jgi:hypothetical protein
VKRRSISERAIRARLARRRREAHWVCASTDDNAARRDAGAREPDSCFAPPTLRTLVGAGVHRRAEPYTGHHGGHAVDERVVEGRWT